MTETSAGPTCNDRSELMNDHLTVWIGIDVGKASHHACAIDDTGKALWSQKVRNDHTPAASTQKE
ncbi:hypothetical protein C7T36_00665 [Rhodococcus sp. AD45-ID]|nr:hypothetical protein C7T36_00665 [Rhodococcus sp. AD45-ID]